MATVGVVMCDAEESSLANMTVPSYCGVGGRARHTRGSANNQAVAMVRAQRTSGMLIEHTGAVDTWKESWLSCTPRGKGELGQLPG